MLDELAEVPGVAGSVKRRSTRLPPWLVSWFQVGPLALILVVLFALPTTLFLIVSFYEYLLNPQLIKPGFDA